MRILRNILGMLSRRHLIRHVRLLLRCSIPSEALLALPRRLRRHRLMRRRMRHIRLPFTVRVRVG
ncbi:hypothetical protein HMPREF3160_05095 [Arthrobacter sp. HMSC06H05]|nr:hypothetical protein HMPREF3160_05095 [Arthrobacter sp. HMSC06H05]